MLDKTSKAQETEENNDQPQRLQKIMAHAGVGSRRACEILIERGKVSVNDQIVTELGTRVVPTDRIVVDGKRIHTDQGLEVFAFHKPAGVVCTMTPEDDRPCIGDYVFSRDTRMYHVGRLDAATEGLLLLTNHGELAHRITHPSYEIAKTYVVLVQGRVKPGLGKTLSKGVALEDGLVKVDKFKILELRQRSSIVEVTIHSGRNRVVRRLMSTVGHPVTRLVRTQIGPISLGNLHEGAMRPINGQELAQLQEVVGL